MKRVEDGDFGHLLSVVIGVDQSYTGFATTVMTVDGSAFRTVSGPLPGKGVERLLQAQGSVIGHVTEFPGRVVKVAREGYAFGATQNAHMAGELGGAVDLAFQKCGMRPYLPTPAQVKKFATGRGNAKKAEVLLGVYKNWGVEFTDDNMADSYVIARILLGEGRNKAQQDVVDLVMKSRGDQ